MPTAASRTDDHARVAPTLLLALAIATPITLWGSAFAAIRVGLSAYSPTELAALRFLVASCVLMIYAIASRMPLPARGDLRRILLCALFGVAGYHLALNYGEQTVTAGVAALLASTGPIWAAVLASLLLGERTSRRAALGLVVSLAGAVLTAMGTSGPARIEMGAALVLLAAAQLSMYSILQKPLLARYRPVQLTTYVIVAGTLMLLPFATGLLTKVTASPAASSLAAAFLGIGPGALGYVAWSYVVSRLPASTASSFLNLVPVAGLVVAWICLGESTPGSVFAGGALQVGGVLAAAKWGRTPEKR